MKRALKITLAILFSLVTILLFLSTIYRRTWDYNETGVHFEEESMTTFDEGAVGAYGFLTVLFLIPTVILWTSLMASKKTFGDAK